ncbi:preprotein translocase subunit SecE [Streptococcus sp. zg-JUN1979]|uniref:preprotein translocase subunit SecE n=1 Tax=Streptococcus sp. zg-JUN1979 TaxID=3391450 RepID=UPI0039A680D5
MRFITGTFKLLRDTTWPSRKQRWKDFIAIMEYTAFFAVIIYIFDKVLQLGLLELITKF